MVEEVWDLGWTEFGPALMLLVEVKPERTTYRVACGSTFHKGIRKHDTRKIVPFKSDQIRLAFTADNPNARTRDVQHGYAEYKCARHKQARTTIVVDDFNSKVGQSEFRALLHSSPLFPRCASSVRMLPPPTQ
jgi:hypothetical protein